MHQRLEYLNIAKRSTEIWSVQRIEVYLRYRFDLTKYLSEAVFQVEVEVMVDEENKGRL